MADTPTSAPATSPSTAPAYDRVEWLENSLGHPIPAELRELVARQIAESEAAWQRGRSFPVPDGTEPAFVFQPVAKQVN